MAAKFYGKAETAANEILTAFQNPAQLPAALAPAFIRRNDDVPCRQWSWANQLLVAIHGHADARGYRQWQKVGRHVRKGERAFPILVPLSKKITETADDGTERERFVTYGFKSAAVFGYSQTEGNPLPEPDPQLTQWLQSLPFREVAEHWGLNVEAYSGGPRAPKGQYRHGRAIALGVQNLATWAHEMIHAADDRLGRLTEKGQHWRSETVAELGGAVLLQVIGQPTEADLGGCWEYVSAYAQDAGIEPVTACQRALKRTCDAVALVLDTAESLTETEPALV